MPKCLSIIAEFELPIQSLDPELRKFKIRNFGPEQRSKFFIASPSLKSLNYNRDREIRDRDLIGIFGHYKKSRYLNSFSQIRKNEFGVPKNRPRIETIFDISE